MIYLRLETAMKVEYQDSDAERALALLRFFHPQLASKIRWLRSLEVLWLALDATREEVVAAVQTVFRDPVTRWVFTGDLLPSAPGMAGNLELILQSAPHRPGVFSGLEMRTRKGFFDAVSSEVLSTLQTALGRRSDHDRVNSGKLYVFEGPQITQEDIGIIAEKYWVEEQHESWTVIPEMELVKSSRFFPDRVEKYLLSSPTASTSFRLAKLAQERRQDDVIKTSVEIALHRGENERQRYQSWKTNEGYDIEGKALKVIPRLKVDVTLTDQCGKKFGLRRSVYSREDQMVGQNLLDQVSGLFSNDQPLDELWKWRIDPIWREKASSSDAPHTYGNWISVNRDSRPPLLWYSELNIVPSKVRLHQQTQQGSVCLWIGQPGAGAFNSVWSSKIRDFMDYLDRSHVLRAKFDVSGAMWTDLHLRWGGQAAFGAEFKVDHFCEDLLRGFQECLGQSVLVFVDAESVEFVKNEAQRRLFKASEIGVSTDVPTLEFLKLGQVLYRLPLSASESNPLPDQFTETELAKSRRTPSWEQAFGVPIERALSSEGLVLKPDEIQDRVGVPLIVRALPSQWTGVALIGDLWVGESFPESTTQALHQLDFLFRKMMAIGAQDPIFQFSGVLGLRDSGQSDHARKIFESLVKRIHGDLGFRLGDSEISSLPDEAWSSLRVQVTGKVHDVRSVRSEDFKFPQERIYWLSGDVDSMESYLWMSGVSGRHQYVLSGCLAVHPSGLTDTLTYALAPRNLGAEVMLKKPMKNGFLVTIAEGDRYNLEEDLKQNGITFEWLGRVSLSPYLVIRSADTEVQNISIDDIRAVYHLNRRGQA